MIYIIKAHFFLFGALIGSFLNVVIHRLPLNQSVVRPRSNCPKCKNTIKWYQNIPILSYLFLRGKCSNCKVKISLRYPLVELFTGCVSFLLFPDDISYESLGIYFFYFFVFCIFLSHFLIDIEHHLLPDKLNIYLLFLILPMSIMNNGITETMIGGLVGFGGPFLITYLFYKLRGQIGLGGGDIKLFGILGLFLGAQGVIQLIFMSSFLGAIIGIFLIAINKLDKTKPLAFGPYIIVVAAIQIYFPEIFEKYNIYNFY